MISYSSYSYNFILNEAPKNNDAICIANNMCSTTMGAQKLSMTTVYTMQKSRLTRDQIMKQHESFVWTEINYALGKNGGYMPGSLGGRSRGQLVWTDNFNAVNFKA